MSSHRDPPRLHESGSDAAPGLRQLFDEGRSDVPAASQVESMRAGLGALLDAPLPTPGPASPPSTPDASGGGAGGASAGGAGAAAGGIGLGKIAAGVTGVVLVVAGAYFGATRAADPESAPATPRVSQGTPDRAEDAVDSLESPSDEESEAGSPSPVDLARQEEQPSSARPAARRSRGRAARRARSSSAASGTSTPAPVAPEAPLLPSEEELVGEAQRVVAGSPSRALSLVRDHARLHPRGTLVQEREMVAIDALHRLGRRDAARARAERFLARWPGSAHTTRIRQLMSDP